MTTKYENFVTPEHRAAIEAIVFAHHLLVQHQSYFAAFERARKHMDNVGHILDPTLYRDMQSSDSFKQQAAIIAAAQSFITTTKEVIHDGT